MKTVIIANGQFNPTARLRDLWRDADLRIAADGGARHAREQFQIAPHVVIGDFDSIEMKTRQWLAESNAEMIQHPSHKDQTDLELALDLAQSRGADKVVLLGALGGRTDQALANIFLLIRTLQIRIVDDQSELWLAREQAEIIGEVGDTVSLIPIRGNVEGVETSGLAYPLKHETLALGTTRGVSNEMNAPRALVRFDKGLLLIVHLFKGGYDE